MVHSETCFYENTQLNNLIRVLYNVYIHAMDRARKFILPLPFVTRTKSLVPVYIVTKEKIIYLSANIETELSFRSSSNIVYIFHKYCSANCINSLLVCDLKYAELSVSSKFLIVS